MQDVALNFTRVRRQSSIFCRKFLWTFFSSRCTHTIMAGNWSAFVAGRTTWCTFNYYTNVGVILTFSLCYPLDTSNRKNVDYLFWALTDMLGLVMQYGNFRLQSLKTEIFKIMVDQPESTAVRTQLLIYYFCNINLFSAWLRKPAVVLISLGFLNGHEKSIVLIIAVIKIQYFLMILV